MRENIIKSEKTFMFTSSGDAIRGIPKINVMFMKQLPAMFPKASAHCSLAIAFMLRVSSGRLVPNATIVAPIKIFGTPIISAIFDAESTIK